MKHLRNFLRPKSQKKLGIHSESQTPAATVLPLHRNTQSQVPRKKTKCMQSRSIERCHAWSLSCPKPMITRKPLRLLSEDMTVSDTCGKLASMFFRFSWVIVYMSDRIMVLSSRTKRTPPLRFKSSTFVRNRKSFDESCLEATGMLKLSYVHSETTTHLCIA